MAYDGQGYAGSLQASEHFSEFHFDAGTHSHHDSEDVAGLKNQASRLSHLLKVMPAGVIVIDGQGIVRQANDQARALLGEPLEGQIWRTIISRSFKVKGSKIIF